MNTIVKVYLLITVLTMYNTLDVYSQGIDQKEIKAQIKKLKKASSPDVRLKTIETLRETGSSMVINPLVTALKKDDDHKVREAAAMALSKLEHPDATNALLELLSEDDDQYTRIYSIRALKEAKETRALNQLNAIVRNQYNASSDVPVEAVKALAVLNDKSSIPCLENAFKSRKVEMQKEAAKALCRYGISELTKNVEYSRSETAKEAAREAIVYMGDSIVDQLYAFNSLPGYMISALVEIGSPKAVDVLIQSLKSRSDSYRENIESALATIGEPVIRPLVEVRLDLDGFLQDSELSSGSRNELAKKLSDEIETLLGELGYSPTQEEQATFFIMNLKLDEFKEIGKPALQIAIALLDHKNPKIRSNAIIAMREIPDPCLVEPLIKTLGKDEEDAVRIQAAKTLAEIKDPAAIDALLTAMRNDKNDKVKEQAAKALGLTKDSKAIDPLITIAGEDKDMYHAAFSALLDIEVLNVKTISFYSTALQNKKGYSSQLMRAACQILDSKDKVPESSRMMAQTHIEKYSTIHEDIDHSTFGKPVSRTLNNVEGKDVVKRKFIYNEENSKRITSEIIEDLMTGREIHVMKYDSSGQPVNQKFICFDIRGNIIRRNGKAVLTEKNIELRKTELYTSYSVYGYIERITITIYPSQELAGQTGVRNCKYIW